MRSFLAQDALVPDERHLLGRDKPGMVDPKPTLNDLLELHRLSKELCSFGFRYLPAPVIAAHVSFRSAAIEVARQLADLSAHDERQRQEGGLVVAGSVSPEPGTVKRNGRQGNSGFIGDHESAVCGNASDACVSQVAFGQP
jgi:hypothetical protein